MREIKCEIVEDLFVSYQDQLTTDETAEMVRSHLAECENCRNKYENLKRMREEAERDAMHRGERFQQKLLKYRTKIIVGGILAAITLFALMILFFILVFFGGPPHVTKKVKAYETVMHKYDNIQCGFATFPESVAEDAEVTKFYFSYQDTWDDPTCEVFLQCKYSSEEYESEIQRLESVYRVYGDDVKTLIKEETGRFNYPAYIAIENHNHGYEYALLSGENEITYVYTAFKERHNIHFDEKYLPVNYGEVSAQVVLAGYSIYLDSQRSSSGSWVYEYE